MNHPSGCALGFWANKVARTNGNNQVRREKVMQRVRQLFSVAVVLAAVLGLGFYGQPASADITVFSDTFASGSTTNTGNAPTANSTSYSTFSSKAITTTMGANDLGMAMGATTGGGAEWQALFTSTPLTLSTVGDYVNFQLTFVNTQNILTGTGLLYLGLYNSGGSAPLLNLTNYGTVTQADGAQGWQGIVGAFATNGVSSKIWGRPAQTLAGADQELLGNGVSSGATYNNPKGGQLTGASAVTSILLNNGGTYTMNFRIWLTASGLAVTNSIFDGAGTGGTLLGQVAGTSNGVASISFDGMAFGWYEKAATPGLASAMDVNSIAITTNVIPEPSTLVLVGMALISLMAVRRRRE
jgi:hypothetical protein